MKSFDELLEKYDWREIRNCPGRYVLRGGRSRIAADELFGISVEFSHWRFESVKDEVIVGKIPGGGFISYRDSLGTYVHTLSDEEGFERKLTELGIPGGTRGS